MDRLKKTLTRFNLTNFFYFLIRKIWTVHHSRTAQMRRSFSNRLCYDSILILQQNDESRTKYQHNTIICKAEKNTTLFRSPEDQATS